MSNKSTKNDKSVKGGRDRSDSAKSNKSDKSDTEYKSEKEGDNEDGEGIVEAGGEPGEAANSAFDNYKKLRKIGEGGYGKVFLVQHRPTKRPYVIKEIDCSNMKPVDKEKALHEVGFLKRVDHPLVIGYKDFFESTPAAFFGKKPTKKKFLYIVMEYADGGDLFARIQHAIKSKRRFSEAEVLQFLCQMCLALEHVHEHKIIHRDIKSENIFLTRTGFIKMGDFGVARSLDYTLAMAATQIGTPYYVAPEIVSAKKYNTQVDMWSLGVIIYELCALEKPFQAKDMSGLMSAITKEEPKPLDAGYSKELRAVVATLLSKDPKKRPSAKELLDTPLLRQQAGELRAKLGTRGRTPAVAPGSSSEEEEEHVPEQRNSTKSSSNGAASHSEPTGEVESKQSKSKKDSQVTPQEMPVHKVDAWNTGNGSSDGQGGVYRSPVSKIAPLKPLNVSPTEASNRASASASSSPPSNKYSNTSLMSLTSPVRGSCHNCQIMLGPVCFRCSSFDCKPLGANQDPFTVCGACNVLHKNKPGSIHDAKHKLAKQDNTFMTTANPQGGGPAASEIFAASRKSEKSMSPLSGREPRPVTPAPGSTVLMHPGFKCSKCGMHPIQGTRHHCQECIKPGFNLCGNCFSTDGSKHAHRLTKVTSG